MSCPFRTRHRRAHCLSGDKPACRDSEPFVVSNRLSLQPLVPPVIAQRSSRLRWQQSTGAPPLNLLIWPARGALGFRCRGHTRGDDRREAGSRPREDHRGIRARARHPRARSVLSTAVGRRPVGALDGDHDLSLGVSFSLVSESFGYLAQLVAPIDDWRNLSRLDELLQDNQIVPGMPRNEDAHPLADQR